MKTYRLILTLALTALLSGQTVSTQILGLVTDTTGAVVPGATITVRRVATGDIRTGKSNETGNYVFPVLEVGEYEISCSAAGFKTEVRTGVVLQIQDKLRLDFQMDVGQQSEKIEVAAATPLLSTDDATLGTVVDPKRSRVAAERTQFRTACDTCSRRELRHVPHGHKRTGNDWHASDAGADRRSLDLWSA